MLLLLSLHVNEHVDWHLGGVAPPSPCGFSPLCPESRLGCLKKIKCCLQGYLISGNDASWWPLKSANVWLAARSGSLSSNATSGKKHQTLWALCADPLGSDQTAAAVNPQIWATERLPSVTPALLLPFIFFMPLPPQSLGTPTLFTHIQQKCLRLWWMGDDGVCGRVLGGLELGRVKWPKLVPRNLF